MPSQGLLPLNTTVEVLVKPHYGKIGRVVGHGIDSATLQTFNVVHVENNFGVDVLELDGRDVQEAPYDEAIWKKHCWTPPSGK